MRGLKCFLMQSDSEIAEMGVEDQNEGKWSKLFATACISQFNGDTPPKNSIESTDTNSIDGVQMPKVRKPYTITKQREKWTEKEHQKFLEALKLYGRGWRRIEEHVGTKTAVQIRSHAQKFFSKLERDSNGSAENPIGPIDIPPARPKRKPLHPYPRKSANFFQGNSALNEQETYPSPNLLVAEEETRSPASVSTACGSDAFCCTGSKQTNGCLSPNSCTTEMYYIGMSPVEKQTDYMTSSSSEAEAEKESLSSVPESSDTSLIHILVKFESVSKGTESSKGISGTVQPSTIKLFGRTVSIPDGEKPLVASACLPSQGSGMFDKESLRLALSSNNLDTQLKLGFRHSNSNSIPGETDWNSLENEQMCKVDSASNASPPWLTLCQAGASNKILIPTPVYACVRERMENTEAVKENSCTGSNSSSISEMENGEKKLDVVDSQNEGPHNHIEVGIGIQHCKSLFGINSHKSSRGFVPYKRCLAERNADSSGSAMEEMSARRARVCS